MPYDVPVHQSTKVELIVDGQVRTLTPIRARLCDSPPYAVGISPRLIGNHALDLPQSKREKCVAAAVQSRSYRLGTDEFAESHHRRGVSKVVRRG